MSNQVIHILAPADPNGLKVVTLGGWTGKLFITPRTNLKDLKDRPEAEDPGIYMLLGEGDEGAKQKLYIGESENIYSRLYHHDSNKDFWNLALIFAGDLNKAKIKFLEHKITSESSKADRYEVINKTEPTENRLSEIDKVETLDYLDKIKYVLGVLGYPVFEVVEENISDKRVYTLTVEGLVARGQVLEGGSFVILKDSLARIRETESFGGWAYGARRAFVEEGSLIVNDDKSYKFTKDVVFKSPSAAAATVAGRAINGWTAWKDESGKTLDENLRS